MPPVASCGAIERRGVRTGDHRRVPIKLDERFPIVWRSPDSLQLGADAPLVVFEGVSSGLLGQDDIDEVTSVIEPGSSAGILIYENVWAAPFAAALRRGGGQLVASGRIPVQAILASLEAREAAEAGEAAQASA